MDYEFDFSVGCDREMWLDNERYKIEKGSFAIRKPGQKVSSKGNFDCYMLTLQFSGQSLYSNYSRNTATQMQAPFESKIWDVLPSVFTPAHYNEYVGIFENLLSVNEVDINENTKTLLLINELLHLIISDVYMNSLPADNKEKTPIDEVCYYIKNHYTEEISLNDLADVAHLNKNYLVRQFKNRFGISPISYLIRIRMEYAKKLLVESNLPVKAVAAECGYTDSSFFNYYFKKTFNISPAAYRHSQQTAAE
jgi:AraC-like DNA-binding protein